MLALQLFLMTVEQTWNFLVLALVVREVFFISYFFESTNTVPFMTLVQESFALEVLNTKHKST